MSARTEEAEVIVQTQSAIDHAREVLLRAANRVREPGHRENANLCARMHQLLRDIAGALPESVL